MRDPFTAMKSGRTPEGSDTLYRFGATARALSRTSEAADVATSGEGLGNFAGSVDAVGDTDAIDAGVGPPEPAKGATRGEGLGTFAGSVDAVGDTDAIDAGVVAAELGGAELAALAATAGT